MTSKFWPYRYIVCDVRRFSRNAIVERCSADRNLLIETMIAEIEQVVLKRFESDYQDDSNK